MKRWKTMTAALVAAGAVLAGAGPAAAQQPGRNGERGYNFNQVYFVASCLEDSDNAAGVDPEGGMTWARGGGTLAITATTNAQFGTVNATPGVYVLGVGPCTKPRRVAAVDAGTDNSFSPDGKQLAIQRGNRVLIIDVATGKTVRDLGAGKDPSWSPDGKRIAYVDGTTIKTRPATGGTATTFKTNAKAPDWSPDGTKIGYLTGGKIAYATASNGSSAKVTPIAAVDFSWSPDGTKVIYTRTDRHYVNVSTLTGVISERLGDGGWDGYAAWQPI